ncbi:MAG: SGNH/GDSL hydrolase family protein [Traorella sp.]
MKKAKMGFDWLDGKIVSALGDSITQGVGNHDISWTNYLEDLLPVKVNNYGIAATKITKEIGSSDSFVDRYINIDPNSDIIIVFGGINDFNHGLPLGIRSSFDPYTFYGALNTICHGLQSKFPMADILFITPMKAFGFKNYPHWNSLNSDIHRLVDYRNAICEVCEDHSIMVLDLYSESGILVDVDNMKDKLLCDGLHPSKEGYLRIARKIANVLAYKI